MSKRVLALVAAFLASTPAGATGATGATAPKASCAIELIVLGTSQDAGTPQIGNPQDPAWQDGSERGLAASLALVDHRTSARYLFEATPDMREQVQMLDEMAPAENGAPLGLSGIFLTHAHIGHYAGLMFLGQESAGTAGVKVFAMPRMREFLAGNGPWGQLVNYGNIALQPLEDRQSADLGGGIKVTPYRAPHRDEFSETVGFRIDTPGKSLFFLPDLDSWERWESDYGLTPEAMLGEVDLMYADASFYDDDELPGRDMSTIPHPRILATMERLAGLPAATKAKFRFIHFNHTNPVRYADSQQSKAVADAGFSVARRGGRICLLP